MISRIDSFIKRLNIYQVGALFFTLTILVYGNSLLNGFVMDDLGQIVGNPNIQSLSNFFKFFGGSTFYNGGAANLGGIYYKPLLSLVFAVNFAIWHQNAFGFHLFSILLHALNASLIFLLFKKLFALENYKNNDLLSLLLSLIFLVHPVNVESITYISSVQEPLYTLFLLMSLSFSISWVNEGKIYSKKLLLICLMVLLSLLSKESGIVSIPIVLCFVYLFSKNKLKPMAISLISTLCVYLFLRLVVAGMSFSSHPAAPPIVNATFPQRLLTIPYEIFSYIRLTLFPKDLFISQQFVIKSASDPRFYLSLPVVLVFIALFMTFTLKLKSKIYLFFFIWPVLSFSIILNIFPLDFSLAERWLYGPLIGILGMTGALVLSIPDKFKKFQILIILLLLLSLPFLIVRTAVRNGDWKDNMALISHDLKLNPDSYELQGDYGTLLDESGNSSEAKKYIEDALKLSPSWWVMYTSLGQIYQVEGNFEKAQELYLIAIKNVNDPVAYQNLSVLKFKTEDPRNSVDFAILALKNYPYNPTINFILALSYYKLGDKINALNYAKIAYNLHPSNQTSTAIQRIMNNQSVDDLIK